MTKETKVFTNYEDMTVVDKFVEAVGCKIFQVAALGAFCLAAAGGLTRNKKLQEATSKPFNWLMGPE